MGDMSELWDNYRDYCFRNDEKPTDEGFNEWLVGDWKIEEEILKHEQGY
jgi:hypothetical protein